MHIKKDLFSTHLGQTCSYSPLLRTSLQHAVCKLSIQETLELCNKKLLSQNCVCVIIPLVIAKLCDILCSFADNNSKNITIISLIINP